MKRHQFFTAALVVSVAALLVHVGGALAYEQDRGGPSGGCEDCHGGFRSSPYEALSDGSDWGDDLHDVHRTTMLSGDCDVCHGSGPRFPVLLGSSVGGALLDPISCSGCHGRAADGTGSGSNGYGAGLRQHHWRAGETVCGDCHQRAALGGLTDADPANFTPVGEHIQPPYYGDPDGAPVHATMPQAPCNDPGNATTPEEQGAGGTEGMDNDGDSIYDTLDLDCSPLAVTLDFFEATLAGRDGVALHWRTVDEVDNVGFRLIRIRDRRPPEVVGMVAGQGSDLMGADYQFVDDGFQTPGAVVYFLEDIDIYGRSSRHGPASVVLPRAVGTPPGHARN